MEVITLKPGYFGKLREVGEKFDVPKGSKSSWFSPVEAPKPDNPKKNDKPDDIV